MSRKFPYRMNLPDSRKGARQRQGFFSDSVREARCSPRARHVAPRARDTLLPARETRCSAHAPHVAQHAPHVAHRALHVAQRARHAARRRTRHCCTLLSARGKNCSPREACLGRRMHSGTTRRGETSRDDAARRLAMMLREVKLFDY